MGAAWTGRRPPSEAHVLPARHHAPPCPGGSRRRSLAARRRSPRPARRARAGPLERYAPVVVHASGEPSPLTSVEAFAGRVPGVPPGRAAARRSTGAAPGRGCSTGCSSRRTSRTAACCGPGATRATGSWCSTGCGGGRHRAGRLRAALGRRVLRRRAAAPLPRPPGRLPRARLARGLLPARRPRPHVARPERRGRRARPARAAAARARDGGVAAVDALPGALGRQPRGLGAGRDGLPARPGVPAAGPLVATRPRWAAAARPCTRRDCDRARRVRRARDRDRGRCSAFVGAARGRCGWGCGGCGASDGGWSAR